MTAVQILHHPKGNVTFGESLEVPDIVEGSNYPLHKTYLHMT